MLLSQYESDSKVPVILGFLFSGEGCMTVSSSANITEYIHPGLRARDTEINKTD